MKGLKLILIFIITIVFQSCNTFKALPAYGVQKTDLSGIYLNDCDSANQNYSNKITLWEIIDSKYYTNKTGLSVKIQISNKNKLIAYLIDNDSIICAKLIKGHFKQDNCYYKKRFFYVVPILPVLWWYENRQFRFYSNQNFLILNEHYDTGGAVIIMAGGSSRDTKRFYKKIK